MWFLGNFFHFPNEWGCCREDLLFGKYFGWRKNFLSLWGFLLVEVPNFLSFLKGLVHFVRALCRFFEKASIPDFFKMVKWIPKILFVSYSCESKPSFYVTVLPSEVSFSFYMVSTTKIGQKSVFSLNLPYIRNFWLNQPEQKKTLCKNTQ